MRPLSFELIWFNNPAAKTITDRGHGLRRFQTEPDQISSSCASGASLHVTEKTSVDIYADAKAQVFVSYASDDRALVANFVKRLSDEAIDAAAVLWYDTKLRPAVEWDAEIMRR